MFEDLRRIDAAIKEHQLSYLLSIAGCFCFTISFLVFFLSVMAVTAGPVPPEAANLAREANMELLFNRWFWAAMLFASILGQIFGYWAHPEAQLKRKLGKIAVQEYQQMREWPWK